MPEVAPRCPVSRSAERMVWGRIVGGLWLGLGQSRGKILAALAHAKIVSSFLHPKTPPESLWAFAGRIAGVGIRPSGVQATHGEVSKKMFYHTRAVSLSPTACSTFSVGNATCHGLPRDRIGPQEYENAVLN